MSTQKADSPTILFGVTSSQSLKLLGQIPRRLVDIGWKVHVVSDNATFETPPNITGVRVHHLPMRRQPSLARDIQSFFRWLLLLKEVKPSIVSLGTPKAALLGLVASVVFRVPVRVYQLRGLRLQTAFGIRRRVLYFFEWLTAKTATEVLAVSPSLMDEYRRLGLSDNLKVRVIGPGSSHGVDTEHFNPDRWSNWEAPQPELRKAIKSHVPVLGFVGRFSEDKGARDLVRCRKALVEAGIEHELLIVGPLEGDERSLKALKSFDVPAIITGPVPDVAPYYCAMDVLLLPTRREGFPNVVLEAASSRVATVTTNATGAVDSVVDGETGLIAALGDTDAFANAVKNLITDEKLRLRLGANARERVLTEFRKQIVTENYVEYFLELERLAQPSK